MDYNPAITYLDLTELGHAVGDPEPETFAPRLSNGGYNYCIAEENQGWVCTREAGHSGCHIAHPDATGPILAIWTDIPPSLRVSEGL